MFDPVWLVRGTCKLSSKHSCKGSHQAVGLHRHFQGMVRIGENGCVEAGWVELATSSLGGVPNRCRVLLRWIGPVYIKPVVG